MPGPGQEIAHEDSNEKVRYSPDTPAGMNLYGNLTVKKI